VYGDLYVLGELILNDNSQLIILNGNLILSGGTISISGSGQTVLINLPTFNDLITSGTYSGGTLTLSTSNGTDVTVNGFFTGSTDVFTTGFTYDNLTNTISLTDNTNTIFNAYIDSVSGLTVNGDLTVTGNTNINSISATTISATTYQNLPQDIFVTGFTYDDNNTFSIIQNSGTSLSVTINNMSGLTVNGSLSATTLQTSNSYIDSTGYLYFGDDNTDGSWRMRISGSDFIVEKRVSGNWIISGTFN
jgi:hypothetical protein